MPGYVIHLAVGKVYEENNKINNKMEFEKGIIAPDLAKNKAKSHYGVYSSQPNLNEYIRLNRKFDEYTEGYFLHLLTDYLFYNRFLTRWDSSIYNDYNKLNHTLIEKYDISIPKEIQQIVKFESGNTEILKRDKLYRFIDSVGKIDLRTILSKEDINFEKECWLEF